LIGSVENYSEVTGRSTAIIHGTMSGTSSSQILDLNAKVKPTYKPNLAQSLSGYDSEGYFANVSLGLGLVINDGVLSSTGGNLTGTGANNRVAFWTGTNNLSNSNNFVWDNGNGRLGLGTTSPSHQLTTSQDIEINGVQAGKGMLTGVYNTRFGNSSLSASSGMGSHNSAFGFNSLAVNSSGGWNSAFGSTVLGLNSSGHSNCAFGMQSMTLNTTGNSNVAIGVSALYSNQTGSSNIAIGIGAGYHQTGSNKLFIENSFSNQPLIGGDFSQDRVGINTEISQISKTLDVNGEVRIRDLVVESSDAPTKIVGADNDGDISQVAVGTGLQMNQGEIQNITSHFAQLSLNSGTNFQLGNNSLVVDFDNGINNEITYSTNSNDITIPSTGVYEISYSGGFGLGANLSNVYFAVFIRDGSNEIQHPLGRINIFGDINHFSSSYSVCRSFLVN
jgi:hypothetical protein